VALGRTAALLRGPPGSGKSDLALRFLFLARRGPAALEAPTLVADDQVLVARDGTRLLASAPDSIRGKMEVRGVAIVEVKSLAEAELALVVDLVPAHEVERLPEEDARACILGVDLPLGGVRPDQAGDRPGTCETELIDRRKGAGFPLPGRGRLDHHAPPEAARAALASPSRASQQKDARLQMIGVVIVAHGGLAGEFRAALEHVVGPQEQFESLSIGPEDDVEARRMELIEAVRRVDGGSGVIVLTDMFGGTPSNLAISVMAETGAEVLAGINLPMLIKLASVRGEASLAAAVNAAKEAGRKYISVASQVLSGEA
jgi:PTS system mannose-specific IIA component